MNRKWVETKFLKAPNHSQSSLSGNNFTLQWGKSPVAVRQFVSWHTLCHLLISTFSTWIHLLTGLALGDKIYFEFQFHSIHFYTFTQGNSAQGKKKMHTYHILTERFPCKWGGFLGSMPNISALVAGQQWVKLWADNENNVFFLAVQPFIWLFWGLYRFAAVHMELPSHYCFLSFHHMSIWVPIFSPRHRRTAVFTEERMVKTENRMVITGYSWSCQEGVNGRGETIRLWFGLKQ